MPETLDVNSPDIQLSNTELLGIQFIKALAIRTSEKAIHHEMTIFIEAIDLAKELIEIDYQLQHEITDYEERMLSETDRQEVEKELEEFCTTYNLDISTVKDSASQDYFSELLRDVTIAAQNLERLNSSHSFNHITPVLDQQVDKLRRKMELTRIIDKGMHFGIFVKN